MTEQYTQEEKKILELSTYSMDVLKYNFGYTEDGVIKLRADAEDIRAEQST